MKVYVFFILSVLILVGAVLFGLSNENQNDTNKTLTITGVGEIESIHVGIRSNVMRIYIDNKQYDSTGSLEQYIHDHGIKIEHLGLYGITIKSNIGKMHVSGYGEVELIHIGYKVNGIIEIYFDNRLYGIDSSLASFIINQGKFYQDINIHGFVIKKSTQE